jgi:quercetin 2,3-dioxygenase
MLLVMSNLERDPAMVVLDEQAGPAIEILEPRDVPLGGPRAMGVRRTLPQRQRSLIGGWCFVDHYGPEETTMIVPPHPHTGLQTVSWLFDGEVEHRDSVGSSAMVLPGEVNLMTAGAGIQHSEVSPQTLLSGVQLWVALPESARHRAPFFQHYVPVVELFEGATVRSFVGSLVDQWSPLTTFSALVGAQVDIPAGVSITLPTATGFEYGVLVDAGDVAVNGTVVPVSHLAFLAAGCTSITIAATSDTRLIVLGGEPLGEQIVMWWNFIGRSHDEIVSYRDQWMAEVIGAATPDGRFGHTEYDGAALPAPELPTVRLKPRG